MDQGAIASRKNGWKQVSSGAIEVVPPCDLTRASPLRGRDAGGLGRMEPSWRWGHQPWRSTTPDRGLHVLKSGGELGPCFVHVHHLAELAAVVIGRG